MLFMPPLMSRTLKSVIVVNLSDLILVAVIYGVRVYVCEVVSFMYLKDSSCSSCCKTMVLLVVRVS